MEKIVGNQQRRSNGATPPYTSYVYMYIYMYSSAGSGTRPANRYLLYTDYANRSMLTLVL